MTNVQFNDITTLDDIASKSGISINDLNLYLLVGIDIEHEHTPDKSVATIIAMHHLEEHPLYYHDKLGLPEMERRLEELEQI